MCKKSFWLSLNPRNRFRRRRRFPPPSVRNPRPPRPTGTRRPVSSEAPGESGEWAYGMQRQPKPGLPPWRRPPFPSVSCSSSSFASRGLPRSFRLLLFPSRGSVPGPGSPGRCSGPSIRFKSVKIVLFPNLRSGAASAASVRSDHPVFRPPRLRLASTRFQPGFRFRRPPRLRLASTRFQPDFRFRRPPRLRLAHARFRFRFGQHFDSAV